MQIVSGIYSLDCARHSNVFFIEEEGTLIDTGIPGHANEILYELKSLGFAPTDVKYILLTHHDVDHTGNVKSLQEATGATVFLGKEDIPYLMNEKSRPGIKRFIQKILRAWPPKSCEILYDDEKIGVISTHYAPGHTPGHHIFQYKGSLFTGDLFKVKNGEIKGMGSRMNDDTGKQRESITMLRDLSFEWAFPSHGTPIKNDRVLQQFIAAEGSRQ
ncbi:MAG: MBL fold metallo-hydrolase [Acetanaerobacterium sp.]